MNFIPQFIPYWDEAEVKAVNKVMKSDYLNEHNASPYNILPDLVETPNGMFETKDHLYPLIFELKATKV